VEYFALSTLYEKLHLANFENLKPSNKAENKGKHKEQQAFICHSLLQISCNGFFLVEKFQCFLTHAKDFKFQKMAKIHLIF
jgi:hypothetical protein